ncbi:MAG: hypothetical protein LUC41_01680, partial [Clostridiales bacterium]|nr:hypothetical protein [Clostridiales bacterium]
MARIIRIDGDVVRIGTDSGGIENVRITDLNFTPQIGDEVDIYRTDTQTIVVKRQPAYGAYSGQYTYAGQNTYAGQQSTYAGQQNGYARPDGGININITNSNAAPPYYATADKKPVNKGVY